MISLDVVDPCDISFVIQGKICSTTIITVESIKKYFPGAEIIISTWKDCCTEFPNVDHVIKNDDPGSVKHNFVHNAYNNQNRQVVSTLAGIHASTRKYICKIRTDFYFENNNILKLYGLHPARSSDFLLFRERVLIPSIYTRSFSGETGRPTPFHPSDFLSFGLKEDIEALFSAVGIISYQEECDWSFKHPERLPYADNRWRFPPEQSIFVALVKKHFPDVRFDDLTDFDSKNIKQSNDIIFNNFSIFDPDQLGLRSPKHDIGLSQAKILPGIITNDVFESEYVRRYDKNFNSYSSDKFGKHLRSTRSYKILGRTFTRQDLIYKSKIHKDNFFKPVRFLLNWIRSFVLWIGEFVFSKIIR